MRTGWRATLQTLPSASPASRRRISRAKRNGRVLRVESAQWLRQWRDAWNQAQRAAARSSSKVRLFVYLSVCLLGFFVSDDL